MKKILTLAIFVMTLYMSTHAQNFQQLSIAEINNGSTLEYCNNLDSIRINQVGNCENNAYWTVFDCTIMGGTIFFEGYANHVTITPEMGKIEIDYYDCNISRWFMIDFFSFENIPEPWTEDTRWLATGETLILEAYSLSGLNYLWPDNSTNSWYTVTGPENSGKVWVRMYNDCGSVSDTINVYYNGDLTMATVDPQTDHIIVT